jgi:hypothetical protein
LVNLVPGRTKSLTNLVASKTKSLKKARSHGNKLNANGKQGNSGHGSNREVDKKSMKRMVEVGESDDDGYRNYGYDEEDMVI